MGVNNKQEIDTINGKSGDKNVCKPCLKNDSNEETDEFETTAQELTWSWLGWAPPAYSACHKTLHECFPGALPSQVLFSRTRMALEEKYGFTPDNALFGMSTCPDEINNTKGNLPWLMKDHWGECFPLGGISGAPFVGKTGFGAFSAHVPDDGNIVLLFAPHVAISEAGVVGKCRREGQTCDSSACGAVIGAYNALKQKVAATGDGEFDESDMQMAWIRKQLEPSFDEINDCKTPMARLAHVAYNMVAKKIRAIINTNFGTGHLAMIGGIQINMPEPYQEHFLPFVFELHRQGDPVTELMGELQCNLTQTIIRSEDWRKAPGSRFQLTDHEERAQASFQLNVFNWLSWAPSPGSKCFAALHRHFPGALPGDAVHARSVRSLTGERWGCTPDNTLFATSTCPDEINNEKGDMTEVMREFWGELFPMGGISGAPFSGKTGFTAFSHHVPDNGNLFVVFGPHVAISEDGEVGMYRRFGQNKCSTACGAVIGAYRACCDAASGTHHVPSAGDWFDASDMQMMWIKKHIAPHVERIQASSNPMADLTHQAYALVRDKINKVVNLDFGSGYLVLLGGIQINMPEPCQDHFLPCMFEVRQKGQVPVNLISAFEYSACSQLQPQEKAAANSASAKSATSGNAAAPANAPSAKAPKSASGTSSTVGCFPCLGRRGSASKKKGSAHDQQGSALIKCSVSCSTSCCAWGA